MDSIILVAIIGATSTVLGPIATFYATQRPDLFIHSINSRRRDALTGKWIGKAKQEIGTPETLVEFSINGKLTASSRVVRGEATLIFQYENNTITEEIEIVGGFTYDRFLRLEYKVKDNPGLIRFGFVLLELSPDGKTLEGLFLSYGAEVKKLVYGQAKLERA